ncbi:MAG: hypothetical protein KO253_01115 [Methanobrevibacter arboriphilus]|nr:hypothetical protein [Methanobrevibacter arboriphilus]
MIIIRYDVDHHTVSYVFFLQRQLESQMMPDYTKTPHEYEKTNTKFPDDFFIFNNF